MKQKETAVDDSFNSETFGKLMDLTGTLDEVDKIENHLTSVIIKQQITENLAKILIKRSDLLINLGLHPEKKTKRNLNGLMFGQIIGILEGGVKFKGRDKFVETAREINKIRIKTVHKLLGLPDIKDIRRLGKKMNEHFDRLYEQWENAIKWYNKEGNRLVERID